MFWRKPKPLYTLRNATEHIMVVGRAGSGKTSACLTRIQKELLQQGAKCLHCCVKPDEADRAHALMPRAVRFSPTSGHIFNPLTYQMKRKGSRQLAAFHDDLTEVLTRSTNDQTESFWKSGVTDLLMASFDLAWLVYGEEATYRHCLDLVMSVPHSAEHAASDAFRETPCGRMLEAGLVKDEALTLPIADLLLKRIPSVGDKARGAFVTQAATSLQPFTVQPLCNAVNGVSTLSPTDIVNGYTILDFDSLTYGLNGLALQLMVSWFCMEEVLARKTWKYPLLLMRDEFPQICHSRRDSEALSVGRSQGFSSCTALQQLPSLEDALGAGLEAQTQAKAVIGLHVNKLWCNNNCHITNEFAAESLGKERKMFFGGSNSPDPKQTEWHDVLGVGNRPTYSFNQQFHYRVPPLTFTQLRTGGPENDFNVDAIMTRGRDDYSLLTINQRKV